MPRKKKVTAPIPAGSDTDGKARLLSLENLDGRTASARRAHTLIAELTADLGGDLSAAQTVLVRRVAAATAVIEHLETIWLKGGEICIGELTTLINTVSRVCGQLGLQRVPRDVTPSIEQFVAEIAAEKAAQITASVPSTIDVQAIAPLLPPPPIPSIVNG